MAQTIHTTSTGNKTGKPLGYTFDFPSLAQTDIKVSVNGVLKNLTTDYTTEQWSATANSENYIEFVNSDKRGTGTVRIFRETPNTSIKVPYTSGSSLRADDLNTNQQQAIYLAEELKNDLTNLALGGTSNIQIQGSNIADNSISTNKIDDLQVKTADIDNGAVTDLKLASDSVTADKLKDSATTDSDRAVTGNHIRDGAVTSQKIANNTIVNDDVSPSASIAQSKLNLSITDSEVNASANINPSKIATGTLPSGIKIDSNNIANIANVAAALRNDVLPSQTGNAGKYLGTDGTNFSWSSIPLNIKTIKSAADTSEVEFNDHGSFYNHPNIHVTINKQGGTKVLVFCSFKMKTTATTTTRPSRARLSGSGNFLYPDQEIKVYSSLYEAQTLIGFDNGSSETGNTTYRLQASGSELNYNNPTDGRIDNAFMVAIEFTTD